MERSYGGHTGDLNFTLSCEMVGGHHPDGQGGEGGVQSVGGGGDGVGMS